MTSPSEPTKVSELLEAALTPVLGEAAEISDTKRLSGGASRETWSFTSRGQPLILRRDPPGRPSLPGAMGNEADVIRACTRAGLAVPRVLVSDDGDLLGTAGMVMTAVAGETIPRRILRDDEFADARQVLAQQVAEFMAGLHAIDPAEVPGVSETDDLVNYRFAYDIVGEPSPTFERAFDWLNSNRPAANRVSVVHGDLRMGNVIVDSRGLAAVIDWELMHLGDPVEDLAWFCVKAWRFGSHLEAGGVGRLDDFIAAYETASGHQVDREVFHWWLVEKTLSWGIIATGQAHAHLSGAVRSHELAAIGRRVAEQEWDLVELLAPGSAAAALAESGSAGGSDGVATDGVATDGVATGSPDEPRIYGRPTAREILDAVRGFLTEDVMAQTTGRLSYNTRVAANMLAIVERQLAAGTAEQPEYETADGDSLPTWDSIARVVLQKLMVANPKYLATSD